jgi:hypothetical protein
VSVLWVRSMLLPIDRGEAGIGRGELSDGRFTQALGASMALLLIDSSSRARRMMLSGNLRLKAIKCHDSGMKKSAEKVGQKWAKMLCQEPRSAAYQWSGPCDAKLEILVPT